MDGDGNSAEVKRFKHFAGKSQNERQRKKRGEIKKRKKK